MDKNCRNCRWYDCGKCNNKHIGISLNNEEEIISKGEDGYLGDVISDEIADIQLALIQSLVDKDYIKKTAIKKAREDEDIELEYKEILGELVYKALGSIASKIQPKAYIVDSREFYCSEWE